MLNNTINYQNIFIIYTYDGGTARKCHRHMYICAPDVITTPFPTGPREYKTSCAVCIDTHFLRLRLGAGTAVSVEALPPSLPYLFILLLLIAKIDYCYSVVLVTRVPINY